MTALLFIFAAICGYLICGLNPAIIISKLVYKKDIRELGSGNAGFTNFKRNFGHKWAWWVLLFDLLKAAVVIAIFATLIGYFGVVYGRRAAIGEFDRDVFSLGAAFTGLFSVLGHSFPAYYKFKGGKGFLVTMSLVWFIDWKIGLIGLCVFMILLFSTNYMSLSSIVSMLLCPTSLLIWEIIEASQPGGGFRLLEAAIIVVYYIPVILMVVRHGENIKRLIKKEEKKFYLFGKKSKQK